MGADINLQAEHEDSEDSFTPLHTACYCVHAATVELLLQKDMDLQVAARGKSFNTALHFASGQGHLDVVKLLLEKGADPYIQNKDLRTPLVLARDAGHDEIVAAFSVASSVPVTD
ncbi:hypothetical protein PAXINDRAFT_20873 [Paxillus involutus ATCC 200175]|uniref:Uncharacterized protein n=1 Tax=Paxillus involutus ATCC 200175 TaxID=664439 RepID=A0A0C9SU43_PAXIN|nr:hypothetical protein PAXINDRAFT_20873 [Paxillus involutus ATCC 200175]